MVILYFAAEWSDECKLVNNVFDELSKNQKYASTLRILYVEAEEHEQVSLDYGIEGVPTFTFIRVSLMTIDELKPHTRSLFACRIVKFYIKQVVQMWSN